MQERRNKIIEMQERRNKIIEMHPIYDDCGGMQRGSKEIMRPIQFRVGANLWTIQRLTEAKGCEKNGLYYEILDRLCKHTHKFF